MKNRLIPKLRFPEFRDKKLWESTSLSDISERITKKVGERSLITVSITAGQGFVSQKEKFGKNISGAQYKNYLVLKNGEFAYNKGNSKRFPQGCIYKLVEFEEAASPNAFLCFRFKEGTVEDFYKVYFEANYHAGQLKKYITSGARGDGLLNINPNDFFSIKLPVTDKNEQQKIADCLSSIDELISLHTKKLKALKDHKKGLLQNLFPQEGEKVPKLRFPEFRDAGEWEEKKLGEVADYANGKAHEKEILSKGKYKVVNSKFISTDGEVVKYTNSAHLKGNVGDILMVLSDIPNGKAIAKCFYVDKEDTYTVNQRICKITPTNIDNKFLFYIQNRNKYFLAFDDGVKQTNLRKDTVLSFRFLKPPNPNEQQKIASCLSSIDDQISAQTKKVEILKKHKKGLTQQLFPSAKELYG